MAVLQKVRWVLLILICAALSILRMSRVVELRKPSEEGADAVFPKKGNPTAPQYHPNETVVTLLAPIPVPPTRTFHIFQVARQHTGSTVLTNMLMGLFEGTEQHYTFIYYGNKKRNVGFWTRHRRSFQHHNVTLVSKTHFVDIEKLQSAFSDQFDRLFFVAINRDKNRIPEKYCSESIYQSTVLCLDYSEILYQTDAELDQALRRLERRLTGAFPYLAGLALRHADAVRRVQEMGREADRMRNESFSVTSSQYGIHGGHRGRDKRLM